MSITYLNGDATDPVASGHKIIVHVCNDLGKWGKGFVMAISKRWKAPESEYKALFKLDKKPQLGDVQFVSVESDVTVANLIGQHDIASARSRAATPPIRYQAVDQGLRKVAEHSHSLGASVHMPRIGCGLAGGRWDEIEPIIENCLASEGIKVVVYDF